MNAGFVYAPRVGPWPDDVGRRGWVELGEGGGGGGGGGGGTVTSTGLAGPVSPLIVGEGGDLFGAAGL